MPPDAFPDGRSAPPSFSGKGDGGLGFVVSGSLTRGVDIKLDASAEVESLAVGRFVTIEGHLRRFFGVVTDVSLQHTDPRMATAPPDVEDEFIRDVMVGTAAYGSIHVSPYLVMPVGGDEAPAPAKTVPPHFARVRETSPQEIAAIFGENDDAHIWIGSPLDMEEAPVCLSADRLTERSTGVFGKTGTGKSFLTRILLAQIVQKGQAVSLIFDMHSEYGWSARQEGGTDVKALKQLFPSKVAIFTVDEEGSRRRGVQPDFVVRIGFDEVHAEDVASLAGVLDLNEAQVQAAERLEKKHGRQWLSRFLAGESLDDLTAFAGETEHEGTVQALHRKLQRLERLPFITNDKHDDSVARIMDYLERGTHVVLEFGRYRNKLEAYILVANLLTRRIHDLYVERVERSLGGQGKAPPNLVIAIEEAHKFLSPQVAKFTTFGTIARELRKYNVTLLVIDQRPSGIDPEVLSQIGTKLTCLLEDDRDIDAVLAGTSGGRELRAVLAKLETKQQALIFGHAVPMPVVVRTRTYDTSFYRSLGVRDAADRKASLAKDEADLFGGN
ncbi:MAG: ATP-binding protein [Chloroflexi bacterium]|nr:ATP-binding protein [Chloroflexota bacterium]